MAATKSKPKKQGIKSAPLDWDRTTEADPRDPRFSGPPCRGECKPAGMYKGRPSGSNQYGKWVVCEVCNLRLSYTPRAGCHGLTRSPGALPSDVKTALNEELPNLESLKDKDIGWAAAEKSAEANLQRIRQTRMAHQASSRGAAPKGKGTSKSQNGLLSGNHGPSDHSRLRAGSVSDLHSGFSGVDRPRAERPGGAEIHSRTEGHPKARGSGGGLGVCAETARSAVSYSILEDEKEIEFQAGQLLEAQNYTIVGIESLLHNMKSARLPTTRSFMEKKAREAFTLNPRVVRSWFSSRSHECHVPAAELVSVFESLAARMGSLRSPVDHHKPHLQHGIQTSPRPT